MTDWVSRAMPATIPRLRSRPDAHNHRHWQRALTRRTMD
jgi:hypothetical protein